MTAVETDDLALWDASIEITPPPCDWSRFITVQLPGRPIMMPDDCPHIATWRVQRRLVCAHGAPFDPATPVNGLICGEHAAALRGYLGICHACGCHGVRPLHHVVATLAPIPPLGGKS